MRSYRQTAAYAGRKWIGLRLSVKRLVLLRVKEADRPVASHMTGFKSQTLHHLLSEQGNTLIFFLFRSILHPGWQRTPKRFEINFFSLSKHDIKGILYKKPENLEFLSKQLQISL